MRRSWLAIMCTMTALGASGALASSASAAATLSVLGTVTTPATYTPGQLAALPQTTETIAGVTYVGVLVEALVTSASPIYPTPTPSNPSLRVTVTLTSDTAGANGGPVTFALGELAANFGGNRGLIALTQDGAAPIGGPKLVLPQDTSTARFVNSVAQINVAVRNATHSTVTAGDIIVHNGAATTTLTAAQLAALPQTTGMTVSYLAGGVAQNRTENGPTLDAVLGAAGITPTANTYVAAVATDDYVAAVTPAEAGVGNRPLLISTAETVTETGVPTTATPRLVTNGDIRGGRYASNVTDLFVGEGTVAPVALPTLTATNPVSPSNNNSPAVIGTAPAGTTVKLYTNATCTSAVSATGTDAAFASPGLTVTVPVPSDATTTFYATATDSIGTSSGCSTSSIAYVEDSTPPAVPTLTATDPVASANNNAPKVKGTAAAGSTVNVYTNATCTGTPAVTGTAAAFASPGLTVAVADNSSTTFRATAVDAVGNASACSTTSVLYAEDSSTPAAPTLTGTDPASPANNNSPRIQGASESGSTIRLYTDAACTSTVAGTGSAALLASFGIAVAVVDNSTTTFHATATDQAGNVSGCSTSSIAYVENSIAPVVVAPLLPPATPPPTLPVTTVDHTPPAGKLTGSTTQKLGTSVAVSVTCPGEACRAKVSGTVRVPKIGKAKAKTFKLAAIERALAKGSTSKLSPKLSGAGRTAIRRALRAGRKITVVLTITFTDAAGNTKTLKRNIRLKL